MRCRRKRPAIWAKMVCPLSSSTENVVLGKTWRILPKTSNGASLVSFTVVVFATRGLALRLRVRCLIAAPFCFNFKGDGARTPATMEIAIRWTVVGRSAVKLFDAAWKGGVGAGSEKVEIFLTCLSVGATYRPLERSRLWTEGMSHKSPSESIPLYPARAKKVAFRAAPPWDSGSDRLFCLGPEQGRSASNLRTRGASASEARIS